MKKPLTEREWAAVFKVRCRLKRGEHVAEEDFALVSRAFESDKKRYTEMEADVFDATVPFGSNVRARR